MSETLVCIDPPYGCGEEKPVSEFSDSQRNVCNACWGNRELVFKKQQEERKASNLAKRIAAFAAARKPKRHQPHICTTAAELVEVCGGEKGFANRYHEVLDEAIDKGQSGVAAKMLIGIAQIVKESSKVQEHREDMNRMTEEELEKEKLSVIAEILAQNGLTIVEADVEDESASPAGSV